jgi:putative membrane protein
MSEFNFETPSRQSAKGILVIFGINSYRILKGSWLFFLLLGLKYLQSGKGPDLSHPWFLLGLFGIVVLLLSIAILQFLNFTFYLKDHYFFLKKGILNKEEVSVSLKKIQNVYIKQNLLQQLIDVVSIAIETAGDDKTEISITALSKNKAMQLKALLLANESDKDEVVNEQKTESVYFKASLQKLLLEGISENHLKSLAIIFAFLVGLYNDLKEFVQNVGFLEPYKDKFEQNGETIMTILLLNLSFLAILLVLALLFSLSKVIIQNFDLTVIRSNKGLEISKGLFNKINLSLSHTRIQKTTVTTNKLKKALGLYQLSFTQANANKKQQINFNIVGLNKLQISELLKEFYPNLENSTERFKPEKYMLYRMLSIGGVLLLFINIGLYFLPPIFQILNVLLVLLIGLNAWLTYSKAYFYVDEAYIVRGGGGLIDTWSSFLEVHKTQSIKITESIFQKQRGLASIKIHSASQAINIPHIKKSDAFNIANRLLYLVESQNKDWM